MDQTSGFAAGSWVVRQPPRFILSIQMVVIINEIF